MNKEEQPWLTCKGLYFSMKVTFFLEPSVKIVLDEILTLSSLSGLLGVNICVCVCVFVCESVGACVCVCVCVLVFDKYLWFVASVHIGADRVVGSGSADVEMGPVPRFDHTDEVPTLNLHPVHTPRT